MLHREDKRRLPIAFIPNGKSNNLCKSFSISDIDRALDYVVAGHIIKMDVMKLTIDHEDEEEIKEYDKIQYCRYGLVNTAFSESSKLVFNSSKYRGCCSIGTACSMSSVSFEKLGL